MRGDTEYVRDIGDIGIWLQGGLRDIRDVGDIEGHRGHRGRQGH